MIAVLHFVRDTEGLLMFDGLKKLLRAPETKTSRTAVTGTVRSASPITARTMSPP